MRKTIFTPVRSFAISPPIIPMMVIAAMAMTATMSAY